MIDESTEKEKKYKFRSLTSNKDVKIKPVISHALEFVISDVSEPTNVAITGNYGAGKSSVIETFELEKRDKKFIHISLAQYDEAKKNELNNREINTIEGKIINQLLHQIEPNSIRKSIFKTLDAESQIDPKKNTVFLFSILLLFLYLNLWTDFIKDIDWLTWTIHPIVRLSALVILFTLFFYGIFYLLKLQRDIGFIKHLSLKSDKIETDIEVFSNETSKVSYFDRYLDDVIYLFKQSKADVIVFEDIERFNDSRIFEKIKELNIVINRKRKVCGESKLVFFYLVKDDLLESQERTKFFDFIIPVVPVVTTSNSYDKLIEILEDMELGEGLDENFLFNISLYLDDMRLINNICNEYLTYKESLSTPKLNPKKVFSMIVYKNIFPKDFSLLQKNQGYLYELLHSKDEQLEERKNELSEKIQLLEKEIENAQTEQLRDEVELYGLNFQIPEGKLVIEVNGKSQAKFSSYHEFIMELLKEDSKITSFSNFYDAHYNQSNKLSLDNKTKLIKNLVVNQKAQVNSYIVLSYFSIHPDFSDPDFLDPDGYSDLIDFINQDSNFILSRDSFLQLNLNWDFQNAFFTRIVSANDLELAIYKSMLAGMKLHYEEFDKKGLSDERMGVLIDLKIIDFNTSNLDFIRTEYTSMRTYFIFKNIEKYLKIEGGVHDEIELNDLLQYEGLDDSYKLQIIDILDYVSLKDKKFSIELITHILDSKFDINDFSYIISSDYYDNADESIKNKIRELTKEHWDKLINLDNSEISIHLCEWLLGLGDIEDSERKNLLKNNLLSNPEMSKYRLYLLGDNLDLFELWEIMNLLSDSDIHAEWIEAFNKLNQNEDVGHNGNQSATVSNCEFNIKLLEYLKKRDIISDKSRPDLKGIVLYGFRSGQIEYQ